MKTVARFATKHRWWVVAVWLACILGSQALASAAGGSRYKDVFTLPGTETQQVLDLLRGNGEAGQTGQVGTVVVHPRTGTLDAAQPPSGLLPALRKLCTEHLHVALITSPWAAYQCGPTGAVAATVPRHAAVQHNPLLSTDDTVGLISIGWQGNQNAIGNFSGVHDALAPLGTKNLELEFTGGAFANLAAQQQGIPPEVFGFAAALIILAIVFRSLGATLLPLLSAAAALGVGLGLVSLLSHVMNVATFATQLASLMVIGVGIDYALFIVTRHRRNLLRGMPMDQSIAVAINTSGRAVLFAGATVCVAILGLCALGVSFLYGVAVGTSIAVALTMIASLTLLPSVLSLLGYRVLPRRVRKAVRDGSYVHDEHRTRWAWWSELVARRKTVLAAVAAGVIVVLAIPFFSMRLGQADQGSDPKGTTTRVGFDLIANAPGFGKGYTSVLELVLDGPTATNAGYLRTVAQSLAKTPDVDPVTIGAQPLAKDLALMTFKSVSAPQDEQTNALVKRLRSDFAPRLERGTTNQIYVFGQTAVLVDFAHVLAQKMPLFFVAVIGLSFLLLLLAFRSLVVPLTAAAMNLFAAGASFGILVAVFQWGWFSEALGIGAGGPIDAFLPVMFFAILFGLSMDYQVFLVSRMHEEWVHTHDNRHSISVGQAETGGIITAAAIIMIAVFGGFLLGNARVIKMIGLGLGAAIFIDAFVLRTVLVPALMHALGRSNWWFPRWLDRITPRVSVEPPEVLADQPAPEDEPIV
ncbi:MAG TPA: MMPL family transporter [Jatrophihabitantaceae bacterium]|jgi:RND superfamily putative drug exporter|nr:MMPL family transporter [Jatrophihabitantaceae bacterium]